MDENHQDKTESKRNATEDVRWVFNKKKKLWLPKYNKWTGFSDKTRWDKLQFLVQIIGAIAIPLSILIGLYQFTAQQSSDRQKATDDQQQMTLQNYLGSMSDLLLKENLHESKPGDVVRQVAEAQTLTALQNLNPLRKGILLQFLYKSSLIQKDNPIVILDRADLSYVDLSGTFVGPSSGGIEHEASLNGADLSGAFLGGSNLDGVDLGSADLSFATLSFADLHYIRLNYANLQNASLDNTNLYKSDLTGADLTGADLEGAKIGKGQLVVVKSLQGTTMPDGSIHP